jgi:hypothetical protein
MVNHFLAFSLGMNLVIFSLAALIVPDGSSLWKMQELPTLIEICEKDLPRNQTCELVAQPKTIERL